MIIETVRELIGSDISATEIEKAIGVDASSFKRIRREERKLVNLSFEKGYFISTYLKVCFLVGLIFIMRLDNLFIIVPYTILIVLNSIYLAVKSAKIKNNRSL